MQRLALKHVAPSLFRRHASSKEWLAPHLSAPQSGAPLPPHLSARQRRIIFRSRQRGWLELDVLLGQWAAKAVPGLRREEDIVRVEALLEVETPHLFEWIVGTSPPPERWRTCVALRSLQEFARGKEVVEKREI